jgi:hypothetical protein
MVDDEHAENINIEMNSNFKEMADFDDINRKRTAKTIKNMSELDKEYRTIDDLNKHHDIHDIEFYDNDFINKWYIKPAPFKFAPAKKSKNKR